MNDLGFSFLTPRPARVTANTLAAWLNNWNGIDQSECDISDILYKPYANNVFRKDDITHFLNLLTPYNCYIFHRD